MRNIKIKFFDDGILQTNMVKLMNGQHYKNINKKFTLYKSKKKENKKHLKRRNLKTFFANMIE